MTYLPILIEGPQAFDLLVGKHTVSVSFVVSRFDLEGKAHLKSWTQCQPCCNIRIRETTKISYEDVRYNGCEEAGISIM